MTPFTRLILLFALVLLLGLPDVVRAHAVLMEATPAIGQVYYWGQPTEVQLRFSDALQEDGSLIQLVDRDFRTIAAGPVQFDAEDDQRMVLELPPLETGLYTVDWRAVSQDGDTLSGAYQFTIRAFWLLPAFWVGAFVLLLMAVGVASATSSCLRSGRHSSTTIPSTTSWPDS